MLNVYERFFNQHEVEEAARVIAEDYRQHNPEVPDGKAPFVSFFAGFFEENPQSRARVVRSASDGDLVYLHVHSTLGPQDRGQAVMDIFRVSGGKIVEHWDVSRTYRPPAPTTTACSEAQRAHSSDGASLRAPRPRRLSCTFSLGIASSSPC